MRILRRIPVQYTYINTITKEILENDHPHDLKIENVIFRNKPCGAIETFNKKPTISSDDKNIKILKLYPKKDVKLLLYDARYDNNVKNIPVYLGDVITKSNGREYTLDELIKLFGNFHVNYRCVSLDYEKLQAMGLDGVHVVNNNSPLFNSWTNGSTYWFNTKWIDFVNEEL